MATYYTNLNKMRQRFGLGTIAVPSIPAGTTAQAAHINNLNTAMNNAYAFATINQAYPYYDKMASKLGVDLSANNGYGGNYRNQSYFSNNNNGQGFNQSSQPEQQVTNTELMDIMNNQYQRQRMVLHHSLFFFIRESLF